MINPSVTGWVDKFLAQNSTEKLQEKSWEQLYFEIQQTGFIYGYVVALPSPFTTFSENWSADEATKMALLNSLYVVFSNQTQTSEPSVFLEKTIQFYKQTTPQYNLLPKWISGSKNSVKLEGILDTRIQTNDNFISKNFSHIVTNALLFIDVIAFQYYLENDFLPNDFYKKIEENCIYIVSKALQTKAEKTNYDDLLLKLFKNSLRFSSFSDKNIETSGFHWSPYGSVLEKYYYGSIAEMALWSDGILEPSENIFLKELAENLCLEEQKFIENSLRIDSFIKKYKNEIPYFKFSNPVKHFYDNTTQNVTKLILRNKKRLVQEISESKELVVLLTQSTTRKLDESEKKKVKKQLIDICKSIPSLTIFLLPGGGLLLPILIKFIPQLLPSAFNENLE